MLTLLCTTDSVYKLTSLSFWQNCSTMNLPSPSLSDSEDELCPYFEPHRSTHGVTTVRLRFRVQPLPPTSSPPPLHPHPTQVSLHGHMQCGAWAVDGRPLPIPQGSSYNCPLHRHSPTDYLMEHCECYHMYHSPFCMGKHCCLQDPVADMNCCTCHMCMCAHPCMCDQAHQSQQTGPSKPAELVLTGQTGSLTRYLPSSLRRNRSEEKVQPIQETNPDSPSELVLGPAAIFGSRYQILVHAPTDATINRSLRKKEDAKMKALRVVT